MIYSATLRLKDAYMYIDYTKYFYIDYTRYFPTNPVTVKIIWGTTGLYKLQFRNY